MKQLLLMIVAVVMVGCVGVSPEQATVANLAKLNLGMDKTQVLTIMGSPAKLEAYETKSGGTMEFLLYQTEWTEIHTRRKDSDFTPLCFIDGKLKGWGRNFYDDTIKIRKEIIKN